jgi:hypothetical protein
MRVSIEIDDGPASVPTSTFASGSVSGSTSGAAGAGVTPVSAPIDAGAPSGDLLATIAAGGGLPLTAVIPVTSGDGSGAIDAGPAPS